MRGETTRVEIRGETTRGETTRGKTSWGETFCDPLKGWGMKATAKPSCRAGIFLII